MALDRCVDEFFAESEQVAFCTSHIVPGIGFSDDPLLQGRNFSYLDTQQSRLGTNWEQVCSRPPLFHHSPIAPADPRFKIMNLIPFHSL